jgi:hypothetical protein
MGDIGKNAWFKDSEGNIIGISQMEHGQREDPGDIASYHLPGGALLFGTRLQK